MSQEKAGVLRIFNFLQVEKIALFLGLAFVFPFLFHLAPWPFPTPIGSVWIPMFYAPLLGVLFSRLHVSLLVAVGAPYLNYFLFGRPTLEMVPVLTLELLVFSLVAKFVDLSSKYFWLAVPAAFLSAKLASSLIFKAVSAGTFSGGFSYFSNSSLIAVPGLLVLIAIYFLAFLAGGKQN